MALKSLAALIAEAIEVGRGLTEAEVGVYARDLADEWREVAMLAQPSGLAAEFVSDACAGARPSREHVLCACNRRWLPDFPGEVLDADVEGVVTYSHSFEDCERAGRGAL